MASSRLFKEILDDMNKTITELRSRELLREERGIFQRCCGKDLYEISYPNKNDTGGIIFDKHVTSTKIIDTLLAGQQYTILLYDKSFIQAEYIIQGNKVIKERLVFMKKHNKIWETKEIDEYESLEEDWFAEESGVPIMLRIDYAQDDHQECDHAATHLTLSNHESCRIPIKGVVTFSEFIRFVMFHFYNIKLDLHTCYLNLGDTITELEKKMIHINWI